MSLAYLTLNPSPYKGATVYTQVAQNLTLAFSVAKIFPSP
jgi:hypothetical protein